MLDDTIIIVNTCKIEEINTLHKVSIEFNVTSAEYHDITTLLYKGIFNVRLPYYHLSFRGKIHHYSTSITNLYEKDQIGTFRLSLIEISNT